MQFAALSVSPLSWKRERAYEVRQKGCKINNQGCAK